jgi:hypothetical protein
LAKYLAKSFHLRSLYKQHGLKGKRRTYRFFLNLYEYEERTALVQGRTRLDQLTGQPLNSQQTVFRRYDYSTQQVSYFYRTNEQLVGKCAKPVLIKKSYRLGVSQPLNLLSLTKPQTHQERLEFQKSVGPLKQTYSADFQEHLLTSLLFFCEKAHFVQVPLEQEQVAKENSGCNANIQAHFSSKPLLHFTFTSSVVPLVLSFLDNLGNLAQQFAITESSQFYT